ncbi:M4 family metallopeptidase [Catenulispora subtropica]|uniref:Zn-dependent metalloprotease n=1 Tax=Catenulispora subtropica TaxID=450798 RepID=A0ABP5EI25_9ACTN
MPRLLAATIATGTTVAASVTALAASTVPAAAAPQQTATPSAQSLAVSSADALVAGRPGFLLASPNDTFVRQQAVSSNGIQYVPYTRTYSGLPVVGGDFVIVTNSAGQVVANSVAQEHAIGTLSTTPTLSSAKAASVAKAQLKSVSKVEGSTLVVYALGSGPAALAWETTVDGTDADGPSRLSVDVDAKTGAVLHTQEHVMHGSGTSAWNGPNPVHIDTSGSGSSFSMNTPNITNMPCQDAANNTTFTKSTDTWGSSDKTSRETGCVDALFGAQTEFKMLAQWDGRNGMDGSGGAWPIRVGDQEENAYYDGSQVQIGYNSQGQWIGAIDVIAHEMGHGVDDHTPGGISGNGTQEFVADTFGAATEWFANEPSPYDVPDFTVGEQINLVGSGPIRNMYNPSALGDPNCYSSSIPGGEVHSSAGPGNHWFYLVAEGSNPTNGQPTSPTCNSSSVTGIGVQNAEKIMYNAMLMKTSSSSYLAYRTWTLTAAKNLDSTCAEFNTVKAAWDAVSVPAQSGDPTCTAGTNDFSMAVSPTSGSVNPGSSLTATVSTTLTSGSAQSIALTASGLPTGATASFSPSSVNSGSSSTMTISTTSSTPSGSSTVTVKGTGASATHTTTFTLTVNPTGSETVNVTNPGNQTSTQNTAITPLTISATDSAGKSLTFSATGLPAGLSISSAGVISGTPTGTGTSSVTVTASSGTASGSATFSWTVNPVSGGCTAAQLLGNAGFETGSAAPWTATAGVIDNSSSEAAHSGSWKAWLDGYGTTHTDTLAQQVTIPASCKSATFSFFDHIDTSETTTSVAYDKLNVQVLNSSGTVLATLATYSNLNAASGYVSHSFNLNSYIGQTISVKFTGTEDSSLQTSFVVDDTALNVN